MKKMLLASLAIELILLPITLVSYQFDSRLINDINIWTKPLKFQFSFIVLLLTYLWLFPLLNEKMKASKITYFGVFLLSISGTLEVVYITLQSARGVASHYNFATHIDRIAYSLMGFFAVLMVLGCFLYGLAIYKSETVQKTLGFKHGASWGMMLGAVFTLFTASILASKTGHWVGGTPSDLKGLPLFGWSTTGGDLRVPHFFATHLMQALPLLGVLSDKFTPKFSIKVIILGAILGLAVTLFTLWQALSGMPFIKI